MGILTFRSQEIKRNKINYNLELKVDERDFSMLWNILFQECDYKWYKKISMYQNVKLIKIWKCNDIFGLR